MEYDFYHFLIDEIPVCSQHRFVHAYEGPVKNQIYSRSEQLLRLVGTFPPEKITLSFRFYFNPKLASGPQDRIKIHIEVKAPESSRLLAKQIIGKGPLTEFYKIQKNHQPFNDWSYFQAVTEIIRLEEGIKPTDPPGLDIRKLNELIPDIYYCPHPFKPREGNDFSAVDKTCSFLETPVLIEMTIQPISQENERDIFYWEIVNLIAINSYSREDFILGINPMKPFKHLFEPEISGLREIKVKDPLADEILRFNREFYKTLRRPQLLFNVKAWSASQEISQIIASTIAESAFEEGSYRLITYSDSDILFEDSLEASKKLNLYLNTGYKPIGDYIQDKGLSRLSHMASVDELKSLFRLPVAGQSPLRCIWKSTDYHRQIKAENSVLLGFLSEEGTETGLKNPSSLHDYLDTSDSTRQPIYLETNLYTKHMFNAGIPGSGKTDSEFNQFIQLYARGINSLIFEPKKTEYRQLKYLKDHPDPVIRSLAQDLRIYTPGKDEISPFRFKKPL